MTGPSQPDNLVGWSQRRTNAKSISVRSYNSDVLGNIHSESSFQLEPEVGRSA